MATTEPTRPEPDLIPENMLFAGLGVATILLGAIVGLSVLIYSRGAEKVWQDQFFSRSDRTVEVVDSRAKQKLRGDSKTSQDGRISLEKAQRMLIANPSLLGNPNLGFRDNDRARKHAKEKEARDEEPSDVGGR